MNTKIRLLKYSVKLWSVKSSSGSDKRHRPNWIEKLMILIVDRRTWTRTYRFLTSSSNINSKFHKAALVPLITTKSTTGC